MWASFRVLTPSPLSVKSMEPYSGPVSVSFRTYLACIFRRILLRIRAAARISKPKPEKTEPRKVTEPLLSESNASCVRRRHKFCQA
jgi:hypothetical protein